MKKPIPLPPSDLLHRHFTYEPETGFLRWKLPRANCVRAGDLAGRLGPAGYFDVALFKVRYRSHRIIWKMVHGRDPAAFIDHIDGDKTNNRIENLREATHAENQRNGGAYRNNSSGYKGVQYHKRDKVFEAWIRVDGRQRYLGRFNDPAVAHAAYCAAAKQLHGQFARTS